jgi:hypothetical protein
LQQADEGRVLPAEAVEKRMKKWLGR